MGAQDARAALDRLAFDEALESLGERPPAGEDPAQWFQLRAQAAYGAGAYDDAVASWEELHRHHRSNGDRLSAAHAAVMTAMFLLIDSGLMSAVRGWVRRADHLLEGDRTSSVHALVAAVRAYERSSRGTWTPRVGTRLRPSSSASGSMSWPPSRSAERQRGASRCWTATSTVGSISWTRSPRC